MTYNPDSADWDYTPAGTGSNSDSGGREVAFYTDNAKPVYTNSAPVNQVSAGQVQTGPGGGGSGPGAGGVATGAGGGGNGPGSAAVVAGPLKPKLQNTTTKLMVGTDQWEANPYWSNADQWEERYGEPGDWIGGVVVGVADVVHNVRRGAGWLAQEAPRWNGAIPSSIVGPDPVYHNGWVSYDERASWERAPAGSPADQYWSF
ncbi:hypothetical protein [Devosia sp. A449]